MLTPYAASKIVNVQLKEAGLPPIPPQMMYNYTTARANAGKTPLVKWDAKKGVDQTDLERWTKAYIEKKLGNEEQRQHSALVEQYSL